MTLPTIGVAVASGTFKGVFGHGVLSAFEAAGFRADVYGCASSSVLSGALAATGLAGSVGVGYWVESAACAERGGVGMSEVVLRSIREYGPVLRERLFTGNGSRLVVAASRVLTAEAAAATQGPGAARLGRRLLIGALRGNGAWAKEHLAKTLFDTNRGVGTSALTSENFDDVAYASTRMLHAWDRPAWVDGAPFVDASYTCACPAYELAELGCTTVVAVAAEPGPLYCDIFRAREIVHDDGEGDRTAFSVIRPAIDIRDLGVDYTTATEEGLRAAYALGFEAGASYVDAHPALVTGTPLDGG